LHTNKLSAVRNVKITINSDHIEDEKVGNWF